MSRSGGDLHLDGVPRALRSLCRVTMTAKRFVGDIQTRPWTTTARGGLSTHYSRHGA